MRTCRLDQRRGVVGKHAGYRRIEIVVPATRQAYRGRWVWNQCRRFSNDGRSSAWFLRKPEFKSFPSLAAVLFDMLLQSLPALTFVPVMGYGASTLANGSHAFDVPSVPSELRIAIFQMPMFIFLLPHVKPIGRELVNSPFVLTQT